MNRAQDGDTVRVHYTGRFDDGNVFDSSVSTEPLEFTIGEGRIIPGFEQAIVGMDVGESKSIKIQADDAFGPYHDEMVLEVERERLPDDMPLEVGQQLQVHQADQVIPVIITALSDDSVTLDANHPLAGKDLIFDIELLEIAVPAER